MATYTPTINLKKPTTSEMYNVLDWNNNSDKIDTAVGTINTQMSNLPVPSQFTALTSGQDLDTITSPGFYGCGTGSIAQSLSNCPTSSNFAMMVICKQNTLKVQVIFNGNIFIREQTGGGWQAWNKATLTSV